MNRTPLPCIPTISFCLCCVLSACKVAPYSPQAPNSNIKASEPTLLKLSTLTKPQEQPACAELQIQRSNSLDRQGDTIALQAVAIGDNQASVIETLGEPHRSTQVETSNGERLAWEYFHEATRYSDEDRQQLQYLIIFDQKTGRVKTIEHYPQ